MFAHFFLLVLVFTNYLILQNGDLGARMVFVEGAGVKAAAPLFTSGHQHDHSHMESIPHERDEHGDEEPHDHIH